MRLIDADALLKALNDYGLSYRADINGMIMQAPTIEPSGDLISRKSLNDIKFIAIKGDKVEEAYRSGWNGAIECIIENAPSAEPTGDLISRADAIESVRLESAKRGSLGRGDILNVLSALPSADAETTVIRSRTLLPTKDFKEWAKRIREENPNVIVIPCDAEVVSADSVVRCKDCKYSFYDKDYESYNCRKHEYVECFDADDYCSWGERND